MPVNLKKFLLINLIIATVLNGVFYSQLKPELTFSSDINSVYVWRGFTFSENPVIQPSVNLSLRNFNINLWANIDPGNIYKNKLNEIDYSLSYKYTNRKIEFEPALQFYTYPGGEVGPPTGEAGIKLTYNTGSISAVTTHNFDIIEYRGAYSGEVSLLYQIGLGKTADIGACTGITWANAEFNSAYTGLDENSVNSLYCNFSFSYYYKNFTIKPRLEINWLPAEKISETAGKKLILNAGISFLLEL